MANRVCRKPSFWPRAKSIDFAIKPQWVTRCNPLFFQRVAQIAFFALQPVIFAQSHVYANH
jgi:hypothetical protein